MKVTIAHAWRSPYGEASWIGIPVLHNGRQVGTVVEEECECRRTACLTLEIEDGILPEGAEGLDHFELNTNEVLTLDVYKQVDIDLNS